MPNMAHKDTLISVADLVRLLGISRQAVKKQLDKHPGLQPKKEVGGSFLYEINDLPVDMRSKVVVAQKKAVTDLEKSAKHKEGEIEKELWAAADKLRGNIDASEYKNIVLGLLFLKYISDAFYKRRQEIEEKTSNAKDRQNYIADEKARKRVLDLKEFYAAEGIFYVPEKARWEYLQAKTSSPELGQFLDKAFEHIEEENPAQLGGVFPKVYSKTTLDHIVLAELINIFSRIRFEKDFEHEKEILGHVYEYFLGQFADSEGKRGGEFFTAPSVVRLIVEILEPYEGARVLDPACGSGGMFVMMGKYLKEHKADQSKLSISGQESNPTTHRLCRMNLAIHQLSGKIELGSSYYNDKFPSLRADFVLANPPFNADWEPSKLADNDPRITLGVPPSGNANFMWVQHFVHHLAPNGMAGFVMPNGALAVSGKEGELRKKMIEQDLVDVIVACPPKLFYNVTLPVSLWFVAKNKSGDRFRKRTGETLFIDARDTFEQISRKQVVFKPEHLEKITGTVRAWRGEQGAKKYKDVAGFCKSAKLADIAKNGYVLTPGRYVGLAEEEDDGVPFEQKMKTLSTELHAAFTKGRELEKEIEKNLKELGF